MRDCLIQLHGELKKRSDVGSFEVVLIPMMMNQPSSASSSSPEDSKTTGIKLLFSQPDCPFFLISSEKAEKIQVNNLFFDKKKHMTYFTFYWGQQKDSKLNLKQ